MELTLPPKEGERKNEVWTINTDGSSTKDAEGVEVILRSSKGDILKYAARLQFPTTNNEAKYEALITRLKLAKMLMARRIVLQVDSQLIVEQVKGVYEAREDRMKK